MLTFTQFLSEGTLGQRRQRRIIDVTTKQAIRSGLSGISSATKGAEPITVIHPDEDVSSEVAERQKHFDAADISAQQIPAAIEIAAKAREELQNRLKSTEVPNTNPEQEQIDLERVGLTNLLRKKLTTTRPKWTPQEGRAINKSKAGEAIFKGSARIVGALNANRIAQGIMAGDIDPHS